MEAKRIEIMDIRQLLELKIKGMSNQKIAALTRCSRWHELPSRYAP
jgi:hypothetical protein